MASSESRLGLPLPMETELSPSCARCQERKMEKAKGPNLPVKSSLPWSLPGNPTLFHLYFIHQNLVSWAVQLLQRMLGSVVLLLHWM